MQIDVTKEELGFIIEGLKNVPYYEPDVPKDLFERLTTISRAWQNNLPAVTAEEWLSRKDRKDW